jgi:predicted transcriptional regulator
MVATKNKSSKVRVTNGGVKGFFGRTREHGALAPEVTVSFENANDTVSILSPQRIRVLELAKKGPKSVAGLASRLNRDLRAVSRDVDLLERFGLLRSRYETNPGHGKRRIVEPRAARYELVATV